MWHYLIPVFCAIPCFAIWTHVASQKSYGSIKPISLYGIAFLGNCVSIAQPAALSYRTSTLYGAAEQAVGGASAVAALSIASIIGPQVRALRAHIALSTLTVGRFFPQLTSHGICQVSLQRARLLHSPALDMGHCHYGSCGKLGAENARLDMLCRCGRWRMRYTLKYPRPLWSRSVTWLLVRRNDLWMKRQESI